MKKVRIMGSINFDTIVEVPDNATKEDIENSLISVNYAPASSPVFQMQELELESAFVVHLATEGIEDLESCRPLDAPEYTDEDKENWPSD